ncbi:MAG: NAD(P)H-dependent oxidoreductase [Porticoccaceae bacterium]
MNVLVINASQPVAGMSEGKLNTMLAGFIREELERGGHEVRTTETNAGYDIEEEVEKHLWADLIITQSPVYWFGNPWTYRKYVEEVFNLGLVSARLARSDGRTRKDFAKQYGTGGLMQGKKYMLSLTWNAPAEAFGDPDQYLFPARPLMMYSCQIRRTTNSVEQKYCPVFPVTMF